MSKPRVFATPYSSRAVKSKRKLNKVTSHTFKFNSKSFIRATRLVSWSVPQIEGRLTANLHISRRLAPSDYSKLDILLWKLETQKNRVLFLPPREFFPFLSFWRVVDFFLRPVRKYLDKIPLPNLSSERLHSVCYAYTFSVLAFMAIGSISGCLTREHTFSVCDIFEFMAILFLPSIIASNLSSGLLGRVPTFQKNVIVLFWLLVFIYGVAKYIPTPGELHEFYLRVPYSNGVLRDNSLCARRWTLKLPWSERTMVEALRQYIVEYKFNKKLPTDIVTRLRLDAEAQISNCTKLWSQFGGVRSKVALDEYLKQRTAQYLKSLIKVEPKLTTVQKFARAVATTLNFVAPIADAGADGVIFVAKWGPVVGALILVGFLGPKLLGG